MFILRKLMTSGIWDNTILGQHYQLVLKSLSPEHFEELLKIEPYFGSERDKIFAIILHESGSKSIALFNGKDYYIMLSDGTTFEKLTEKEQ